MLSAVLIGLSLITFGLVAAQQPGLDFSIEPAVAKVGATVVLTCKGTGQLLNLKFCPTGSLSNCDDVLKNGFRMQADVASIRGTKQSVDASDAGVYLCEGASSQTQQTLRLIEFFTEDAWLTPGSGEADGFPTVAEPNATVSCRAGWVGGAPLVTKLSDDSFVQDSTNASVFVKKGPTIDSIGGTDCLVEDSNGTTIDDIMETVYLHSAVFVYQDAEKNKNLMEGDDVSISCKVKASPVPTITWLKIPEEKDESEPVPTGGRFQLQDFEFRSATIPNGTLRVTDLEFSDRGKYVCVARNQVRGFFSNNTIQIPVQVRDKLAALWPFLGIVAEVVILCIIIFICEKRREKKALKADADQNGTEAKVKSSNGEGVRQRK